MSANFAKFILQNFCDWFKICQFLEKRIHRARYFQPTTAFSQNIQQNSRTRELIKKQNLMNTAHDSQLLCTYQNLVQYKSIIIFSFGVHLLRTFLYQNPDLLLILTYYIQHSQVESVRKFSKNYSLAQLSIYHIYVFEFFFIDVYEYSSSRYFTAAKQSRKAPSC